LKRFKQVKLLAATDFCSKCCFIDFVNDNYIVFIYEGENRLRFLDSY